MLLRKNHHALQADNANVVRELRDATVELDDFRSRNVRLREMNAQHREQNDRLREQNDQLHAANHGLLAGLAQIRGEIEGLLNGAQVGDLQYLDQQAAVDADSDDEGDVQAAEHVDVQAAVDAISDDESNANSDDENDIESGDEIDVNSDDE